MSNEVKIIKRDYTENLIDKICKEKANLPFFKMVLLGFLAGAYISFGGELMNIVTVEVSSKVGFGLSRFFAGLSFSLGLILVVQTRAELFTGNTLMLGVFIKGKIKLKDLLRNWIIVYFSNFLGSLFVVLLVYLSNQWKIENGIVGISTVKIALSKVNLNWIEVFVRGILANWLVCLAIWMALASSDTIGKVLAIIFPIMAFVASFFEHSIANMYLIPIGILLKKEALIINGLGNLNLSNLTWSGFIFKNLIPSTLGNIIGGGVLVSLIYSFVYNEKEYKIY